MARVAAQRGEDRVGGGEVARGFVGFADGEEVANVAEAVGRLHQQLALAAARGDEVEPSVLVREGRLVAREKLDPREDGGAVRAAGGGEDLLPRDGGVLQ